MSAYIGDTTIYDGVGATGNVVTTTLPTDHGALSGLIDNDHIRYVGGPWYNVQVYGALGNGTTDDTAAIQAAWAALVANGKGVLYFPMGTYLTTGVVLQSGSNFLVTGERGSSIWTTRGSVAAPTQATHNVLTIADCTDFTVSGLVIDGRRDTIAGTQLIASNAASGQKNVMVQDGTKYQVGEMVQLFGGLTINGGAEKDRNEPFQYITIINGNVLTLTTNFVNSYTAGAGGAYVTRYQTGDSTKYTAAGRALGNEDAQNGLHLLNCQRFQISNCVCQNVWESPIKCGTGFATTNTTDGCADGVIANNICYHGYDQGVSVWYSQRIAVVGNVCKDAGWGGVVFTHANDCSATGNVCTAQYYEVPGDTDSGSGIAIEGGERIVVSGNVCTGNKSNGVRLNRSPMFLGTTTLNGSTIVGATSITVNSATFMKVGSGHTLIDASDPTKRENVTVASINGLVIGLAAALRNAYANGSSVNPRYNFDVALVNNVCSQQVKNAGISVQHAIGLRISGNDCSDNGLNVDLTGTAGIYVNNECHGAAITDNTCSRNSQEGIFLDACYGLTVEANLCTLNGATGAVKHGMKCLGLRDGSIVGNHLERNTGDGICLEDGSIGVTTRMTIANNACRFNSHRGIFFDNGQPAGNTISGNTCMNNGEPGIHLGGGTSNIIANNVCANQQGQQGIRLDDWNGHACNKNVIIGNALYDDRGGSAQQNFGLQELGGTANSQVAYNRVFGNTSGQLSLAGSSTSTGNIIS